MPRIALKSSLAIAVVSISSLASGQVVFSDGLTHTIPGDMAFSNGQWISLQSASGLNINSGAVANGADGSGNQSSFGGSAINALAGTSIQQLGGQVTGGDGNTNADSFTVSPVSSTGGDGIRTGGSYIGTGGSITGGIGMTEGTYVDGFSVIVPTEFTEATGGAALSLTNGATATLDGVALTGGESWAYSAQEHVYGYGGPALRLNDSGPVTVLSGEFFGGTGNAENFAVNFADATGLGGACFEVNGSSTLTIESGTYYGGIGSGVVYFEPEPALGIGAAAIKITGPSTVTVNGGTFNVGSSASGTLPPAEPLSDFEGTILVTGDNAAGDMLLTINGGSFNGLYGLETIGTRPNSLNSRIDILGGNFNGNSFVGDDFDISLSNPDILTTIYGSDFLLDGNPVSLGLILEEFGTLEGMLADGSNFAWDFERFNNAPLMLAAVPEPTSLALVMCALPLLRRRRVK